MAWQVPRTWSPGEMVTAVWLNQELRDNLSYLKTQTDALASAILTLSSQVDSAGVRNVGTSETTLFSYVLPTDTLSEDLDAVRITVLSQAWNDANNKRWRLKFGATTIWDSGDTTNNGDILVVEAVVSRIGVGAQFGQVLVTFGRGGPDTKVQSAEQGVAAEDETANITIAFTGQSSAGADEIYAYSMLVEKL